MLERLPEAGRTALQRLCAELGYPPPQNDRSSQVVSALPPSGLASSLRVLARATFPTGNFDIIHAELEPHQDGSDDTLPFEVEREAVDVCLSAHPHALFVFSSPDKRYWHFVNVPYNPQTSRRQLYRRLELDPDGPWLAAARCVAQIDLSAVASTHQPLSPQAVQRQHDGAFDPRTVVEPFYRDCQRTILDLAESWAPARGQRGARLYALRLVTRLLFVCMLQRTGWLGNDPRFLSNLWRAYRRTGRGSDSFVRDWLDGALFPAFSTAPPARAAAGWHLPPSIRAQLLNVPQVRGGLFDSYHRPGGSGTAGAPTVTDADFDRILSFLESHALAAREDTAQDQRVAIGPAMLGTLHEAMVNVFETDGQRSAAGIYYTAPPEVDLMCRLAFGDWLATHLGRENQPLLLQALFAPSAGTQREVDAALARRGLWPRVRALLDSIAVLDPACGSGAFLVGMLLLLDGLVARANHQLDITEVPLERMSCVLSNNLYGIDIKPWAVQVARSRLWLQLLASTPAGPSDPGQIPRLPDLDSKIVCGESLTRSEGEGPEPWSRAEERGFDLVIGNPPYVRQEMVGESNVVSGTEPPPGGAGYKARLARAVQVSWPQTFGCDGEPEGARLVVDGRSDLYVYFFYRGLALLRDRGTLCFVTSSSWLMARYGQELQRFLLTRGQLKLLIDNQASRSFDSAEVNTAIVLLGVVQDAAQPRPESLRHVARVVVLRVPFVQAFDPNIWVEATGATSDRSFPDFHLVVGKQAQWLEAGGARGNRAPRQIWLRKHTGAPDLLDGLLERYGQRLVRLKDIAEVWRGITTGANHFFFLDEEAVARWEIEQEYLVPAVKSPRTLRALWLDQGQDMPCHLFLCRKERAELRDTAALAYIEYGESQGFHLRPTCLRRRRWWDLGDCRGARVHCNYLVDTVMRFYASDVPFLAGDSFQAVDSRFELEALVAACNSTLCQLSVNLLGRANFGGGLLKLQTYEVGELILPDPRLLGGDGRELIRGAGPLGLGDQDRQELDEMIAGALGLSQEESKAIHAGVSSMVTARVEKAKSMRRR